MPEKQLIEEENDFDDPQPVNESETQISLIHQTPPPIPTACSASSVDIEMAGPSEPRKSNRLRIKGGH